MNILILTFSFRTILILVRFDAPETNPLSRRLAALRDWPSRRNRQTNG